MLPESRASCAYRRSPVGAQNQWRAVKAMRAVAGAPNQRFHPPTPERPHCKRFGTPEGCPFGDDCTHLHSLDGINDLRDEVQKPPSADAPRVFLHKMEDRKVALAPKRNHLLSHVFLRFLVFGSVKVGLDGIGSGNLM